MNLRNIAVVLSANTTSFRSQMAMAARDVEKFDKNVQGANGGMSKFSSVAAAAAKGGALAIAVGMVAAAGAAMQFETRMRNVNSISHLSEEAFRAQNAAVLDMSKKFPQSANVLAEGLYDIASSGFQGAEGMMVLASSAKAASAGMSDTATSAKAITAVLNAYGLEAKDAERVGNVLFQGVNVGVMSFEELAGAIGNVVGTAAAAGVNIEDLTAGIATMTLSGISADEAATSMNRTLQGLIDPSDSLAASINALGYESGVSMLNTLGLHGTMEKLRTITGGNIEVLMRYFPEIRAARGALALMSAEGENYNKVQQSMNDAQKNGGAMQATFNEQMKSTSAQLKLVQNNITAAAVAVGTTFLPYVRDGIKEVREFGNGMADLAREGKERLEPFFKNIRPTIENVKDVMGELGQTFGPVVAGFAALAAIGVLETFNKLSTAVAATTGFLADHGEIVAALATMYGVHLVGAAFMAGGAIDGLVLKMMYMQGALAKTSAVQALVSIQTAAYGVSAAFSTAGITGAVGAATTSIYGMLTPMALVGIAAAGLVATFVMIRNENERLATMGTKAVSEWEEGFDASKATFLDLSLHLHDINEQMEKMHEAELALKNDQSNADQAMQALGFKETKHFEKAQEELEKLQKGYEGYNEVVASVAFRLKTSYEDALKLVREQGVAIEDVADGTAESESKQQAAIRATVEAREEAIAIEKYNLTVHGATQNEMQRLAGLTGDEFEAEAARIMETATAAEEFAKKVGDAWRSQMDVVSALGDQVGVTGGEILNWYDTMAADGEKFAENIRKAIAMGYDPGLIARTIEAGPAQAGPLLQAMVDNQDKHFRDRVNASEQALTGLNQKAVELARLTNRAMNAESDVMARDLQKAMELSTIIMATGGKTTMAALTWQLGIGEDEVTRIANEYGISLAAALDPVRGATGLPPIPRRGGRGGMNLAIASGGYIDPKVWGDTNADTVPAWVMPGEVVIKKKSVEKWGVDPLLRLNEGIGFNFAGGGAYAQGGIVGMGWPNYPAGTMGDTSESASAQTYAKALAFWTAQQSAGGGFSRAGGGGPAGNYTPGMLKARSDILNAFGNMSVGGYANRNIAGTSQKSAHGMWRAWDFMVGMGNVAKGNAISRHLIDRSSEYGLKGLIWNAQKNFGGGWAPYKHPGASGPTAQHLDHVHAEFFRKGGLVHRNPWDAGGIAAPGWNMVNNTTGAPEKLANVTRATDRMPQISVNVNVYIGDTQLRGMIRQEVTMERDKETRRTRSMSDA